jgi:hypothetical protein
MSYFVRFNQNSNQVFPIKGFNESLTAGGRSLTLNLDINAPEDSDKLASTCSAFLVKNAISKLEILNANEVVVFSSETYHEAASFDVSLNRNRNINDEDEYNDHEIDYNLMFRIDNE